MIISIAMGVATLWEIIEFASDEWFGTFSQGADLYDTMMDLIYGIAGGVLMAVAWTIQVKRKKVATVNPVVALFERLNKE
jgi:hypothetical protein